MIQIDFIKHLSFISRVDAIKSAEEERQTQIANRVNPLDHELQKTKEQLKSPSLRHHRGATPNKDLRGNTPHRDVEEPQRLSEESHPQTDKEDLQETKDDLPELNISNQQPMDNVDESIESETDSVEMIQEGCKEAVEKLNSELSGNEGAIGISGVEKNKQKEHVRQMKGKKKVEKRNSWTADPYRQENVSVSKSSASSHQKQRGSSHEPELENIRARLMNDIKTFENSSLHKTFKD